MGRLLRFEWRRVRQHRSFYIITGIMLLLLVLFAWIMKSMADEVGSVLVFSPTEMTLSALSNATFAMLLGIYVAIYVCDDHSHQTLKNIYAKGYSRPKVYAAKYLISLGVSLVWALGCMLVALVLSEIFGNSQETLTGEFFGRLVLQLWLVVGYHGVYFGVAQLIGRTGGSVAVNLIGMTLLVSIVSLVLMICNSDFSVAQYWLDQNLKALAEPKQSLTTALIWRCVLLPVAYTVVFVGSGYLVARRREA